MNKGREMKIEAERRRDRDEMVKAKLWQVNDFYIDDVSVNEK